MKRIPMSQEGRLKETLRRRKIARAVRIGVLTLAGSSVAMWIYVLMYDV